MSSRASHLVIWISLLMASAVCRAEDEVLVLVMPDDVRAKFGKLDRDGDRSLTWDEYRSAAAKDKEPAAKRDFHLFDLDHDGKLTPDEFWAIPSSVTKASTRGPLDDPVLGMMRQFIASLDQRFEQWDQQPKRLIAVSVFKAEIAATIKFDVEHFTDEEIDPNENGVSREEARRFIEIHFGVRRADGRLLREPNGRVRQHQRFQVADSDRDGRLSRDEFVERSFIPGDLPALFAKGDADQDGFLSWDEWCEKLFRVTDPVVDFLKLDTDGDGQVSRDELLAGTPKHLANVAKAVFPGFDFDRDGQLSLAEYRLTMLANPVAKWHDELRDADGDDRLSWPEFNPGTDVPFLRFAYFHRLDANRDGFLDSTEYLFRHRTPRAFHSLTIADGSWWRLFQLDEFPAVSTLSISRDGQRFVFDAHKRGEELIHDIVMTCKLDGSERREVCKGMFPCWSPDGRQLATGRGEKNRIVVIVLNADSSDERMIHEGRGPQWSPDGKRIALSDNQSLLVHDLATNETRRVVDVVERGYERLFRKLEWSPDGRRIAFVGHKPDGSEEIATVTIDEQKPNVQHVYANHTLEGSLAWHPSGDRLVFPMRNKANSLIQLFEIDPAGKTEPTLVKGQDPATEIRAACWTPDGKQLIVITGSF